MVDHRRDLAALSDPEERYVQDPPGLHFEVGPEPDLAREVRLP